MKTIYDRVGNTRKKKKFDDDVTEKSCLEV